MRRWAAGTIGVVGGIFVLDVLTENLGVTISPTIGFGMLAISAVVGSALGKSTSSSNVAWHPNMTEVEERRAMARYEDEMRRLGEQKCSCGGLGCLTCVGPNYYKR
jgi:hypothetical protein